MSKPARLRTAARAVVRTPLLPLGALAWPADRASGRAALAALLERPEVSEAIFLASPSLHAEVAAWRARPDDERGRGIERALVKYVARMAARATPFGTFAGVAVVPVERQERLEVGAAAAHRRRTRVDNDVLFALAAALARQPEARARLAFAPNSSLTRVAGRLRYAEARPGADGRGLSYHLVAVEPTSYLDATLARARGGATLDALAAALCEDDPEIARDEADGFVAELAETQLLVPALGVAVTGPEPIDGMIAQLEAAGLAAPAAALVAVRAQLAAIDARGLGATPEGYAPVVETLQAAMAAAGDARTLDAARLFQVDLAPALRGAVGRDVVVEAERAIEALRRIGRRGEDPGLVEFRRAFTARWEDAMVPLAEVLDEEAGIGFEAASGPGSEGSPLLAGLPFPPGRADRQVSWGARERWLLARLGRAVAEGADEITLSDDDLRALAPEAAQEPRLPDAIAAMVRVGRRDGQLELLLESAGGPSGARLLGRFCHLDADIAALVRDHVAAEEALRPDAVFAEVVHLAEGRNGNILCRPVLRAHEIVYLGQGGAAAARQLGLDDLLVSVRGDRVILWSRRLDREVVPRLSSAHNARNLGLGVYRFLVAVQGQGVDGLGWSWGPLADAPFLPRVRRGRVVLERARWRLDADELAALAKAAKAGDDAAFAAVQALRDARRLPRHVVLADADNELWVDLDDALQVDAFADAVRSRRDATLVEAFPAPDAAVVAGPDGAHACEVVLTMVREPAAPVVARSVRATSAAAAVETAPPIIRRFPPGSRWLYGKLYGGVSSADRVLREAVAPVVREALASGAARRWFFLRYADPQPHLRLRLDGDPARLLGEVLPALERATAPLLADGALWRVALDTYEREVERYGGPAGIELAEDVFWHDAEAALAIVERLDGDEGAEARWLLALRGADDLLAALGLSAAARAEVFTRGKESLSAEHRATVQLHKAIGERWRDRLPRLDGLLARDADRAARDADDDLAPGLDALAARDAALAGVAARLRALDDAGTLVPTLRDFAWSLVHMSCNRLLHASQRAQELVINEFLRRHHARARALDDAATQEARG